jgi:anti-sigma factor ChrR (cupin superfamily)
MRRVAGGRNAGAAGASGASNATAHAAQPWKAWDVEPEGSDASAAGLTIVRAAEEGWVETDVPGVSVKRLRVDRERRYVTMLVRMAPGSAYPSHRHAGAEECFVLEGDLHVGDAVLRAGDYQCAHGASLHSVQSTENGCLLLISSSQEDELL